MDIYPKIVAAEVPLLGRMYYLVDEHLDIIPEVKDFLDWKAATKRAPATIKAYCFRLSWYYRFLWRYGLNIMEVGPPDLTEFLIWLCNPYRDAEPTAYDRQAHPIQETSINLILQAVGALYYYLVRRGALASSPVVYVDVPRSKWLAERDLLVYTRRGQAAWSVQRMELKLKEPDRIPLTVSEEDFRVFVDSIHREEEPNGDPSGFRDRLLCLMLKDGGFRIGELLGMHMEDLDFGQRGAHVRFRPHNENLAHAKSGYGRDRFVNLPTAVMSMLDIYITEVWIEANPEKDYLWIVLKKDAKGREGNATYGAPLTVSAVEKMFQHYSHKSGVIIHPHLLRHTHATELVRSYLCDGEPVDWKFIQERLGHASVVTTMEIYIHLTRGDFRLAYERYEQKKEKINARH
jgi:integrase/recombinase XerD